MKVKILLSYHNPSTLLKSDVFVPIHVGRSIQKQRSAFEEKWLQDNLIGDDTGINISQKNLNFCELTAQYWAWKNLPNDVEYVGFMHYRRHLVFSEKVFPENKWGLVEKDFLDKNYISDFGLDDDTIKQVLQDTDIVTVKKWNVASAKSKNNYDHYANSDSKLHIKDYDLTISILEEKYPSYKDDIMKYNESFYGYYTNIFIMRRDLFNQYCEWLFGILFELEKRIDISQYDFQEARVYGYISEWLFGIFMTHLQANSNVRVKELQRTIVHNTAIREPMFLCFASDDNYAKPMGVAIASILSNKHPGDNIHIYVLENNISDENRENIFRLQSIAPFTIEYVQIDERQFESFPLRGSKHFSFVTWYRLVLPSVLKDVEKLLYLDCDIVVNTSLYPLYTTDMKDEYICGVIDFLVKENCTRLQLERYVNAGVLMVNLEKMRQDGTQAKFFSYVKNNSKKILWNDQDVLNVVCNDGLKYVDSHWNVQVSGFDGYGIDEFQTIGSHAYVMHFISEKKPWEGKYSKWDKYYYKYVRLTPWRKDINRYYVSIVMNVVRQVLKWAFSIEKVDKGKRKQVRILGLPIKFACKNH